MVHDTATQIRHTACSEGDGVVCRWQLTHLAPGAGTGKFSTWCYWTRGMLKLGRVGTHSTMAASLVQKQDLKTLWRRIFAVLAMFVYVGQSSPLPRDLGSDLEGQWVCALKSPFKMLSFEYNSDIWPWNDPQGHFRSNRKYDISTRRGRYTYSMSHSHNSTTSNKGTLLLSCPCIKQNRLSASLEVQKKMDFISGTYKRNFKILSSAFEPIGTGSLQKKFHRN